MARERQALSQRGRPDVYVGPAIGPAEVDSRAPEADRLWAFYVRAV